MSGRFRLRWVLAAIMALVSGVGIARLPVDGTNTPTGGGAAVLSGPLGELISQLEVSPEPRRSGYDRDLFEHWIDADANGCNTRCEVLARDRRSDLAGFPHGGWVSSYDGVLTDNPRDLQVDHVVALAEAWDSGAAAWDATRRRDFANDLTPGRLVAVTAASNEAKSDGDPAQWRPPLRESWCTFAANWVWTKLKWKLSADQAEVNALAEMAAGCDTRRVPVGETTAPPDGVKGTQPPSTSDEAATTTLAPAPPSSTTTLTPTPPATSALAPATTPPRVPGTAPPLPTVTIAPSEPLTGSVYFVNCDAAKAAGAAPVRAGDPGYRPDLDRDGDGVGCES